MVLGILRPSLEAMGEATRAELSKGLTLLNMYQGSKGKPSYFRIVYMLPFLCIFSIPIYFVSIRLYFYVLSV